MVLQIRKLVLSNHDVVINLRKLGVAVYLSYFMFYVQIFEGGSHVNVSHIIHDLSFGPKYPGIHNPLDGTTRILQGASGTFKYYIKVNHTLSMFMALKFPKFQFQLPI